MAQEHTKKRIEVWFQDEARFGQQGTITRKWGRTGSRPPAIKQTQYDWLYVLGAACPETGQTVGLISPHVNTEVMNTFLDQFAKQIDPEVHAVMIWDQAGYHGGRNLKIPDNIDIIPLPPYSPELNPVENLWHYLRSHYWSNRIYEDYNELADAVCESWQATCLEPELVKTVCRASYIKTREV
ncbi:MAG: IS630 family transposase [Planctomycetota bacterium]|nr:MAG: IS630 family transposase [Planctomycetota bacterium]